MRRRHSLVLLAIALAARLPGAALAQPRLAAPGKVRVAVCQTQCIDSDIEGNLRRIEYALEEAAAQGAQLACFAETVVIGWINPAAHDLAQPIPGPISDRIVELAERFEVMIAIGITEKDEDDLYDSAILIDRDGTILHKHRKVNTLSELMDPPYTSGSVDDIRVVDTRLGRIGMLICADTFEDANVLRLASQRPALVVVPYGWAADPDDWPGHAKSLEAWVTNVAERTQCPVVGTDLVGSISDGPWRGKTYGGQSIVIDRGGTVLGVLRDRDADVRVFELDLR